MCEPAYSVKILKLGHRKNDFRGLTGDVQLYLLVLFKVFNVLKYILIKSSQIKVSCIAQYHTH